MVWGILTYMDESCVVLHFQYIIFFYLFIITNLVNTSAINNADDENYRVFSLFI